MHINWHGDYTVSFKTSDLTIVVDPHGKFRGKADIVALSNPEEPAMSHVSGVQGEPTVIERPGEYAINGLALYAMGWHDGDKERSIMRWHVENMVVMYVGALNRELTDEENQDLQKSSIDVLILPVGGKKCLDAKQAVDLITKVEPRVVIPVNFDDIKPFAKEMGIDPKKTEPKIILKANKLPTDETETYILEK